MFTEYDTMDSMGKKRPIAVTGASGYIASWIVKKLMEKGYTVHATVRSFENKEKIVPLLKIQDSMKRVIKKTGKLVLFEADLLTDGDFDHAFQECNIVIHTASPFFLRETKNPKEDFIDPALKGTENVLQSASNIATVKKVVLTSSIAAMYGSNVALLVKNEANKKTQKKSVDLQENEEVYDESVLREDCWNTNADIKNEAYRISKTLAEKRAWEIAATQKQWALVVMNPGAVIGPSLTDATASGTVSMMKQICQGDYAKGVPNFSIGYVDVRVVADAHIKAAISTAASGRYILVDKVLSVLELTNIIKKKYTDKIALPSKHVPKLLVWLLAKKIGLNRKFIYKNVNIPIKIDNTKSKKDLDMTYGTIEDAILLHVAQITNIPIPETPLSETLLEVLPEALSEKSDEALSETPLLDENTDML